MSYDSGRPDNSVSPRPEMEWDRQEEQQEQDEPMYGDVKTSINAKPAEWPDAIALLFEERVRGLLRLPPTARILEANYFTPRPYVDEYNRGSSSEGFTLVVLEEDPNSSWPRKQVHMISWLAEAAS